MLHFAAREVISLSNFLVLFGQSGPLFLMFRYLMGSSAGSIRVPHACFDEKKKVKVKVFVQAKWHIRPELATGSISTAPWMGCWSIAGLPPALSSPVSIYTRGWGEAL